MTYSLAKAEKVQHETNKLIEHVTFMRDQYEGPAKTIFRKAGVTLERALADIDRAVDILKEYNQ